MSLPQPVPPGATAEEVCGISERWTIHPELARRICLARGWCAFGFSILSGYRSREEQLALKEQGRPAADPDLSTHCACPATGADLWPDVAVTQVVKAELGRACVLAGLRWGGGSPVDPQTGIPSDWNHFDLGPRNGAP